MHPQIAAFARLASENAVPTRKLEGQLTRLGRTMHDMAYDPIHDEIVVGSPFAQAILTFRGGANGEARPVRIIQGSRTQIVSQWNGVDRLGIDPVNNELYVGTLRNRILVFDREANGDVAPKRVLGGPDTQFGGNPVIRVDAERNLLLVTGDGGILIFDRTASGNTKPRAVIRGAGPIGGAAQFELYNGLIIAPRDRENVIYAWSINDTGQDVRPVFTISAPLGERAGQLGIALDPIHKEVLVGTGAGNQIRTFSIPEIFDYTGTTQTSERR
jgi:hypothetical protein